MKVMACIVIAAVALFCWRHIIDPRMRPFASVWARRALSSTLVAAVVVALVFVVLSINSWKVW